MIQYDARKPIYILLTQYRDTFSRAIGMLAGSKYMHTSIGLEDRSTFFSFNTKRGFCIETPLSKIRHTPCMLYRLDVPEYIYNDIAGRIQGFIDSNGRYKFNFIGTVLCLMRLPLWCSPFKIKDRYYCAQFVSELLYTTGAATLRKPPARFLPKDFSKDPQFRLCYKGALFGLAGTV